MAGLAVLSMSLPLLGACSSSKPSLTVEMVNFTFRPVHVTVAQGASVEFHNGTQVTHNFTLLRGGTVSFDVAPGDSQSTADLAKLGPGTYPFRCNFHYKQGMIGVLTVTGPGS